MIYSKIDLMQIEKNDIPDIKNLSNILKSYLPEHREVNIECLNEKYESHITNEQSYHFSIRGLREGGFSLSVIGYCSITNIDWISRHAEINVMMHGDGGTSGIVPYTEIGFMAFEKILEFCFEELNLQKLVVEIIDTNEIKMILDRCGFVAEGVRRQSRFKNGRFVDSTICSILAKEYREKKK